MSDLIGAAVWAQYKSIINDGHDTFNQHEVIWLRSDGGLDRHGEDNETEQFTVVILKGLFEYNYFRKWRVTNPTDTGEIDAQTEVLLLNLKYLRDNGYLTAANNFNYQIDADRFIHDGIKYKCVADTKISQAQDEPLLLMLVLQREEIMTADQMGALPIPSPSGISWPLPPNIAATQHPFVNVDTVTITHNLGRYVDVTIYDSTGAVIEGDVSMDPNNLNEVVITFASNQSGTILIQ